VPKLFSEARITLIPKPINDATKKKHYRQISSITTDGKISPK
jgi:hypothetical protein